MLFAFLGAPAAADLTPNVILFAASCAGEEKAAAAVADAAGRVRAPAEEDRRETEEERRASMVGDGRDAAWDSGALSGAALPIVSVSFSATDDFAALLMAFLDVFRRYQTIGEAMWQSTHVHPSKPRVSLGLIRGQFSSVQAMSEVRSQVGP